MANQTISIHAPEQVIADLTAKAKALRRSRNSLLNEAVEVFLYPPNGHAPKPKPSPKKKAGTK